MFSFKIFVITQVLIHSLVNANLRIEDALLEFEAGSLLVGKGDGRPVSTSFPLVLAPSSKAGMLFSIHLGSAKRGYDSLLATNSNVKMSEGEGIKVPNSIQERCALCRRTGKTDNYQNTCRMAKILSFQLCLF